MDSFCRRLIVWLTFVVSVAFGSTASAQISPPNILWITSEDNAAHWLGCYGNAQASTPALDAFAAESIRFTRAYANAPVCAVARSTLLTGAHAPTMGTQHMRSRYGIDARFRPYVSYLREVGFYCTNNSKTDYNFRGDDRSWWDDCSTTAHYRNRAEPGRPFFAVVNLTVSHESSLFPETVRQRRRDGTLPPTTRLAPAEIELTPYLPDLPEIREDIAIYHDVMSALDRQFARVLAELEAEGLADETIVIYCSDHGGPTPRGKRYLHETGVRVPLMIRIPKAYPNSIPFPAGSTCDELVSFVDLAPTILSLVGLPLGEAMSGRPFLGPQRREPTGEPVFLYADRFDEIAGMRRGVTDGRFKYVRCFTPHLPAAPYSQYPLSIPGWKAWQSAARDGRLDEVHRQLWEPGQPIEALYDLERDPWELSNLADDPEHGERLAHYRGLLFRTMLAQGDTSLFPEGSFESDASEGPISERVKRLGPDFERLARDAFEVFGPLDDTSPAPNEAIRTALASADPSRRYWGMLGLLGLRDEPTAFRDEVTARRQDESADVRILAARVLHRLGETEGARAALVDEFSRRSSEASTTLLLNAVADLGFEASVPESWIRATAGNAAANEYHRRFAERLEAR